MSSSPFATWWHDKGSAIAPHPGEEQSEHAERVAFGAWIGCLIHCGKFATSEADATIDEHEARTRKRDWRLS